MELPAWFRRLIARIEAATNGYLPQMGWIETRVKRTAMDADGTPIPWFTYPAIGFLEKRIRPGWRVLEFGSGAGTVWWSRIADSILSLEHEPAWLEKVSANIPGATIETSNQSASDYYRPAFNTGTYDAIVVDGLFREECLAISPELLTDSGIIILDDAERPEYQDAIEALVERGFRKVEFRGPQPISKWPGCTTIFYRDKNILDL